MSSGMQSGASALTRAQEEQFVYEGFVKVEDAFPRSLAEACCEILWRESGCRAGDPATWTRPVIRIGDRPEEPFRRAANSEKLHAAFDQLVGVGRWVPRESLGGFPLRFPHGDDPGDTGWHIDASFPPDGDWTNYTNWHINLVSKGRALLMLFLFTDVGEMDGPTRIRIGSHLRIAPILPDKGEAGLAFMDIASAALKVTADLAEVNATGPAGTVYLCHPFLVHAAQSIRGVRPRFIAQPPLYSSMPFSLNRSDGSYSLVERAILLGLE